MSIFLRHVNVREAWSMLGHSSRRCFGRCCWTIPAFSLWLRAFRGGMLAIFGNLGSAFGDAGPNDRSQGHCFCIWHMFEGLATKHRALHWRFQALHTVKASGLYVWTSWRNPWFVYIHKWLQDSTIWSSFALQDSSSLWHGHRTGRVRLISGQVHILDDHQGRWKFNIFNWTSLVGRFWQEMKQKNIECIKA